MSEINIVCGMVKVKASGDQYLQSHGVSIYSMIH